MEKMNKIKTVIKKGFIQTKEFFTKVFKSTKEKVVKGFEKFLALPKYMKTTIVYICLVAIIFGGVTWWQRSQMPFNIITNRPPIEDPVEKEPDLPGETDLDDPEDDKRESPEKDEEDEEFSEEDIDSEPVFDISNEIMWPIDGLRSIEGKFREEFQYRDDGQPYYLDGIIIAATKGSNVRAALPGEVVDIAESYLYGKVVKVVYVDPDKVLWESIYYNLENTKVEIGQNLTVGDSIGSVGSNYLNQNFSEEHLYFELKKNKQNVDPELYLN